MPRERKLFTEGYRKMKSKAVLGIILTLLLTSILVLAFTAKSVADTYYYNFNLVVTPESTTCSDEIEVTISFEPASISFGVTFGSLSQMDNQFLVNITIYVPEAQFYMLGYEEKTYNLGKLPAGIYSFNATVTITGWGSGQTHHNKSFSVTSPPVGGIYIPVNKLELLAPYIGLTMLLAVALVTVVYVKKRKRGYRD